MSKTGKMTISIIMAVIALFFAVAMPAIWNTQGFEQQLDKQQTVSAEIAMGAAVVATGVAAIPDDSTTPIADQIMNVASYSVIASVAILIEKFLLIITPGVVFRGLIPVGCLFMIAGILMGMRGRQLQNIAKKVLVLGICLWLAVPTSLYIDDCIDRTLHTTEMISKVTVMEENVAMYTDDEETQEEVQDGKWYDWLGNTWNSVTGAVSSAAENTIETVKNLPGLLNDYLKATSAMILSTLVIPILTLLMLWNILKWALGSMMSALGANIQILENPVRTVKKNGKGMSARDNEE